MHRPHGLIGWVWGGCSCLCQLVVLHTAVDRGRLLLSCMHRHSPSQELRCTFSGSPHKQPLAVCGCVCHWQAPDMNQSGLQRHLISSGCRGSRPSSCHNTSRPGLSCCISLGLHHQAYVALLVARMICCGFSCILIHLLCVCGCLGATFNAVCVLGCHSHRCVVPAPPASAFCAILLPSAALAAGTPLRWMHCTCANAHLFWFAVLCHHHSK